MSDKGQKKREKIRRGRGRTVEVLGGCWHRERREREGEKKSRESVQCGTRSKKKKALSVTTY